MSYDEYNNKEWSMFYIWPSMVFCLYLLLYFSRHVFSAEIRDLGPYFDCLNYQVLCLYFRHHWRGKCCLATQSSQMAFGSPVASEVNGLCIKYLQYYVFVCPFSECNRALQS